MNIYEKVEYLENKEWNFVDNGFNNKVVALPPGEEKLHKGYYCSKNELDSLIDLCYSLQEQREAGEKNAG